MFWFLTFCVVNVDGDEENDCLADGDTASLAILRFHILSPHKIATFTIFIRARIFCTHFVCDLYYWLTHVTFMTTKLSKVKFLNTCQSMIEDIQNGCWKFDLYFYHLFNRDEIYMCLWLYLYYRDVQIIHPFRAQTIWYLHKWLKKILLNNVLTYWINHKSY